MMKACLVILPLLLVAIQIVHSLPASLTSAQVTSIRTQIRTTIDDDLDAGSTNILLAGLVRLSFHDCVGDACDGCINMDLGDNAGLQVYIDQIEALYASGSVDGVAFADLISRADLWALGAIDAIEYGCEKAQKSGCGRNCEYTYPDFSFQTGRVDCATAPYDTKTPDYPSGIGNTAHVLEFFANQFGFGAKESVAILGAHSLGAAHREDSGFVGPWVEKSKQFSNSYYIDMLDGSLGWEMTRKGTSANRLYQWNSNGTSTTQMMLNSDMCLVKDMGTITDEGEVTECDYNTCPDADADVLDWVKQFAVDNDLFLEEFGRAFQTMVSHGYTSLTDVTD